MLRELILFSADLTETASYHNGTPPPVLPQSSVSFEVVSGHWPDVQTPECSEFSNIQSRLDRGDDCILGRNIETGRVEYCLWLTSHPTYLDWIFTEVIPLDGHVLLYNAWVHPDLRGGSLHWAGAARACQHLISCGQLFLCAGVELNEFKPFAGKYAQLGLAVIVPYASLWGLRLFDRTFHMMRPPRTALVQHQHDLRVRYGPLFPGQS